MGQAKPIRYCASFVSHLAKGVLHLRRYVRGGPLRRQHFARAEPLTALPRSARSRVSLSRSGCLLRAPPLTFLWDSRRTRSGRAASRTIKEDRFCSPSLAPPVSGPSKLGAPPRRRGSARAQGDGAGAPGASRPCSYRSVQERRGVLVGSASRSKRLAKNCARDYHA